jgi:uncharacterized membrane protein YjdF
LLKNYEFLFYIATLFIVSVALFYLDKKYNFSKTSLSLFSAWVILHFCGGSIYISGTKLYDKVLIPLIGSPLYILRYDQIIHLFCYIVITLFIYQILRNYIKKNKLVLGIFAFLGGIAIGALNEIIEFSTVILFGTTGVGDYFNNALDLVSNSIGAIIAVLFYSRRN